MKRIYLNLKRFDVPKSMGGINQIGEGEKWATEIVKGLEKMPSGIDYTVYFQESSVISAVKAAKKTKIGCQGVYRSDVEVGKNFGAFTTLRTASSMAALNVTDVIIGHCEERKDLNELLQMGGGQGDLNEILNKEIACAVNAGMRVLYCIGEKSEEQEMRYDVLSHQLKTGLKGIDLSKIAIAYEPVWAIGPGKTPPDKDYIEDIARHIKSVFDLPVVYGGGLKKDNAKMIASIKELDGGLIALTRFGADFGFYLSDFEEIVKTYMGGIEK